MRSLLGSAALLQMPATRSNSHSANSTKCSIFSALIRTSVSYACASLMAVPPFCHTARFRFTTIKRSRRVSKACTKNPSSHGRDSGLKTLAQNVKRQFPDNVTYQEVAVSSCLRWFEITRRQRGSSRRQAKPLATRDHLLCGCSFACFTQPSHSAHFGPPSRFFRSNGAVDVALGPVLSRRRDRS
jgi:hypothetical protein